MIKRNFKVIAFLIAFILFMNTGIRVTADEVKGKENRFNVVFVTDESGSMKDTDPEGLRYEAIHRFIGLMAQEGNYLGSISFDDEIIVQQDVNPVDGFKQKEAFVEQISSAKTGGYTDIGLGLTTAVEALEKDRDPSLPSVIILLTDGNTDLREDEAEEGSLALKADAIERARQAGYVIYTICLNTDGSADISEMQQIASATGGEFTEVKKAKDLVDVETLYYKMIFGSIDGGSGEVIISNDGTAFKEFDVPSIGVEEINIVFDGSFEKCEVTDPAGKTYSDNELAEVSMIGRDFTLVKIAKPIGGTWTATAFGSPGTRIDFKLLYNSTFYIETSVAPAGEYQIGDVVTFKAQVCDMNGIVSDMEKYQNFRGTVYVSNRAEENSYSMTIGSDGFTYDYTISDEGTFYVRMSVADGDMIAESDEIYEISVNNATPIPAEELSKVHVNRWPFIGGAAKVVLNNTAADPEEESLTFEIQSTAFTEEDYSFDGTELIVDGFSIPKGSFTIRATDPHGAYCEYDILVTSTNIGLIMALIICAGTLLVLVAMGMVVYKKKLIPFMGTITVQPFNDEEYEYTVPYTVTPGRGSIRLASFVPDLSGLPNDCKFQAGGKEKSIYFVSKRPVYSNITGGERKKIKIDGSGTEVRISVSSDMERGITVTFSSLLYNQF